METIKPWEYGEDSIRMATRLVEMGYTDTPDGRLWWTGIRNGTYVVWPDKKAALQAFSRPWSAD